MCGPASRSWQASRIRCWDLDGNIEQGVSVDVIQTCTHDVQVHTSVGQLEVVGFGGIWMDILNKG